MAENVIPFRAPFASIGLAARRTRQIIEDEIERLIALLDAMDGDCDNEEDDDAGDPLEIYGEHPSDDGRDLLVVRPIYGSDQSLGPINEQAAAEIYFAEQRRA